MVRRDLAAVLGSLAFAALLLVIGDASATSTPPWEVDAAIGVLACVALWWRRRWPLATALAMVPLGAVAASATAAMTVALFGLAAHRPMRVTLPVAVASWAGVTVYFGLQNDPEFPVWVDLTVRGALIAAAVGWGRYAGAHRQLVASLRERAARLEAEQQRRVDQARLTERARIAREMHDVLAHRLSLVSLHAGALEVRTDARPEEVASAAGVIRVNAHEALDELRAVIGVLRQSGGTAAGPEPPQPELRDLPELVASTVTAGTPVRFACTLPDGVPRATGRTVYRIVQEALTNARKHAPGTEVDLCLEGSSGRGLLVRVRNAVPAPVPAADPPPGAGLGLVGLAERIDLAGGRLVHGVDAREFMIEAWLPWPD